MSTRSTATQLLVDWRGGDKAALNELIPLLYEELRRLAHHHMHLENAGHTLQTTALVNEAFVRLVDVEISWRDRAHFLSVAAHQMRRILVDYARTKASAKRGGRDTRLVLDESLLISPEPDPTLVMLNDALEALARFDERKSKIVELLYFGGLSYDEAAEVVGVSRATLHRELTMAKAWLYDRLYPEGDDP